MQRADRQQGSTHRDVLVFGISGATWRVIDPMLDAGELPNLRRLRDGGCSATLASVRHEGDKHFRPQVAWASAATGCRPDRHGLTHFYHTSDDLLAPPVWDHFQAAGASVGIYGWPMDWPPRPLNGFVVPSHWARDTRTWPPELAAIKELDRDRQDAEREGSSRRDLSSKLKNILAVLDLGISARGLARLVGDATMVLAASDYETRSLRLRNAKLRLSTELFSSLCRRHRPGFRSFHTFLVDLVSHRYWRYFEPELFPETAHLVTDTLSSALPDAYRRVDAALGRLMAELPKNSVTVVLSEHGMAAEPVSAEVGEWRYVIDGRKLAGILGLGDRLVACPVARWIAYLPTEGTRIEPGMAGLFRNLRVAQTGLPLFNVHEHGNEIIIKFNLERQVPLYEAGQLEELTIVADTARFKFTDFTRRLGRARSAMHDGEGILLLAGPGIRSGQQLAEASVLDIAPTILKAAGLPVPSGLDGDLLDIFS